jgi:hypothetical protein
VQCLLVLLLGGKDGETTVRPAPLLSRARSICMISKV